MLTGISLLLVHAKGKKNERLSETILLLLISVSVFSILGYFFQVTLFYGLFTYVPMAIHAATGFLFTALCFFFFNCNKGLMISLTSTLAGSLAARRLIPAAILVPVLLGILRTVAHKEAIFTTEFGITILIFTIIIVLLSIIWHNTVLLNKRDLQRQKAEKAQRQSEEQIQTIFNSAPDAVIVINEEGTIIKWNPKAETIFGWHGYEVVGRALQETIIPPRYREAHRAGLRHFLKSGEGPVLGRSIELKAITKNNKELDVALSISPTLVDGKYLFIGFVRDITEQKKAGEQIKESEEKFQKAFQASSAGISITRLSDTTYLDVNDAFTKLTGFSREELIGHSSSQLGMVMDIDKRESLLQQIRDVGSSKNFEIAIRDKSGRVLEVLASVETIFLQGEKYALNIIYDITDQKKAEQKFRGLLESAPDAMIIVNEKGEIVLANHQTEVLFDYQKQELIGHQVEMLLPGDLQRKHETHRSDYFKHRKVRSMGAGIELFGVRKDGSRFPVEISLS
jgi:PAS domain S-box-containing protein